LPNTYILKLTSKLLLGKFIFTFTYDDLEFENIISNLEFEMLNELK